MGVAFWVEAKSYEIGTASFLKSFFSTVFIRCEHSDWGSRFPTIMNELYIGELPWRRCEAALAEIEQIQECLAGLPPADAVWDFENRRAAPPWGEDISPSITSLADYYVTSDGKDLLEVLGRALSDSLVNRLNIVIR